MRIVELGDPESALTVVVPTADIEGEWFPQCLRSIRGVVPPIVHIVAVESAGSEFNFSRSVNAGIIRATGDVLIFNDDALLGVGALEALTKPRKGCGEGV